MLLKEKKEEIRDRITSLQDRHKQIKTRIYFKLVLKY